MQLEKRTSSAMISVRSHNPGRSFAIRAAAVLAGSMLMALSAQISVTVPFSPVPITGQSLAVPLLVAMLGRNQAVLAIVAYLVEGALGAPVFSRHGAGLAWFAGPTAGYLIGFPIAAFAVGWLFERGLDRNYGTRFIATFAGTSLIFVAAAAWLVAGMHMSPLAALAVGVTPFIIGDVAKNMIAAGAGPSWAKIARALGV